MPVRTPHRIRTTRRVTLVPGVEALFMDVQEGWFSGEIIPPDQDTSPLDSGPPRGREAHVARWPNSTVGPGALAPTRGGERIESGSLTYELLGVPRKLRTGRRDIGVEVSVMPLDDLYPERVDLQDQGGNSVMTNIRVALWADATSRSDQGMYYTYTGEVPMDYWPELLVKNRQMIVNDIPYRIVDPFLLFEVPRVQFVLRGPR